MSRIRSRECVARCSLRARWHLATLGRLSERPRPRTSSRGATQGVETRVLWPAVKAVVALKSRDSGSMDLAEELVNVAFEAGAVDLLVCAYRSNPELLTTLLSTPGCVERTIFALSRAGDSEMAGAAGGEIASSLDPRSALSAREREVYDLVCAGSIKPRDRGETVHQRGDRQGSRSQHVRQGRGSVTNGAWR